MEEVFVAKNTQIYWRNHTFGYCFELGNVPKPVKFETNGGIIDKKVS